MPQNRSFHRDFPSLEWFIKNLEKGPECAILNNPVGGGMIVLKSWSSRVGMSNESTDEVPSKDLWSFTIVRLTIERRALRALPPFSSIFTNSKEIGTIDPQCPWKHLDHQSCHIHEVVEECAWWNRSEPSNLEQIPVSRWIGRRCLKFSLWSMRRRRDLDHRIWVQILDNHRICQELHGS